MSDGLGVLGFIGLWGYGSKSLTRGLRLFGCAEIIDKHTKLRTRTFNNEIEFTIIFVLFANAHIDGLKQWLICILCVCVCVCQDVRACGRNKYLICI